MNKSHVQKTKLGAGEREINFVNYEVEKEHFLENLLKKGEGVELEIEVDGSLSKLIEKNDEGEELFDVSIVPNLKDKPEKKVALSLSELSKFMKMINTRQCELQSLHRFNCVTGEEIQDTTSFNDFSETSLEQSPFIANQTVYTTPFNKLDKIRQKLPCEISNQDEKPGTPCLCQHCGMVGVLVESQKHPMIPHTPNSKYSNPHKKKSTDSHNKSKSETNLILLQELNNKVNSLEKRLKEQEEKFVKKDFFKIAMQKLLSQCMDAVKKPESTHHNTQCNLKENHVYSDFKPRYNLRSKVEEFRNLISTSKPEEKHKIKETKLQKQEEILKLPSNTDNIKSSFRHHIYMQNSKEVNPFRTKRRYKDDFSIDGKTIEIPNLESLKKKDEQNKKNDDPKILEYKSSEVLRMNENDTNQKSNKYTIEEKMKYLRILAKRKNVDERVIWSKLLEVARKHLNQKTDSISVQISKNKHRVEVSEIELTLESLEEIAKKVNIKRSKISLKLKRSSCESYYHPKIKKTTYWKKDHNI